MATAKKANGKSNGKSNGKDTSVYSDSSIALLMKDHKEVKRLFNQFKKLVKDESDGDEKSEVVALICKKLTAHAQLEEEIFYPTVRAALDEESVMDEATVEHEGAKRLIAELEAMSPEDALYDAKVTVLSEYIEHHVKEEEGSMFPQAKKAKVLTEALGEQLAQRHDELAAEAGADAEESDEPAAKSSKKGSKASQSRSSASQASV